MPLEQLGDIESKAVLKATAKAHQALDELKGLAVTMPNQYLLLNHAFVTRSQRSTQLCSSLRIGL
jgi:hypothetical protein